MIHIARYAHLAELSALKVGDRVTQGQRLARMGNTGKSTGAHVHFDLVQVAHDGVYRLADIPRMIVDLPALMTQYHYFLDEQFFQAPMRITTSFGDPWYTPFGGWTFHPGYDLVPVYGPGEIFWNRSKPGEVVGLGFDTGYGFYIQIKYEA